MSEPERPLSWYAALMDTAASEGSRYRVTAAAREALGYGIVGELPSDAPIEALAVCWAVEYHVEISRISGKRRAVFAPRHDFGDETEPPALSDVDDSVKSTWAELLPLVSSAPAKARIAHLLWEVKAPDAHQNARLAIDAYIESAEQWDRALDAVHDLSIAVRLARAINREADAARSMHLLLDLADRYLGQPDPPAGVVLRALAYVAEEPGSPERVDSLLERASTTWPDANRTDQALAIMLTRAADAPAREAIWRRRVNAFAIESEAESSKIMRSARIRQALRLAEQSQIPDLRELMTVLLQTVRHDQLEMVKFSASSRQYEEEFERFRDSIIDGATWTEALFSIGRSGPLSGWTDKNRDVVRTMQAEHPLASLLPTQMHGPDNMPFYTGTTEADRFEVDLVRYEGQLITYWIPPLVDALHTLTQRHGLPPENDLTSFLRQWPGVQGLAPHVARALQRYWTGDYEAVAYTLLPRIEAQARGLVLASHRGIYRLQQESVPGQYAGLGKLLPILAEEYELDESHLRFLQNVLIKPTGFNLRNQMLHGLTQDEGAGAAALLIHVALLVGQLEPRQRPAHVPSSGDGGAAVPEP